MTEYHAFYITPLSLGRFLTAVSKESQAELLGTNEIVTVREITDSELMLILLKRRKPNSFIIEELRALEEKCNLTKGAMT